MKRFVMFIGNTYELCGGWEDFAAAYDTHIVDLETFEVVAKGDFEWTTTRWVVR